MSTENKVFITPEGEHDYNKQYEQYSIVKHTHENNIDVYFSIKPVPPFIAITDKNYWKFLKSAIVDSGDEENIPQTYKVDDILQIPAEMLENCKVGDIFTEKSMPTGFPSDYNGIYQVEAKATGGVYLFFHSYFYDYNVSSEQGFEPSFGFLVYSNMWGSWEPLWYPLNYFTLKDLPIYVADTIPDDGMRPNTLYNLGELTNDTTFTMAAAINNTLANVWTWTFSTGSTAPTITWPVEITMWSDGEAPEIEANKYYEVSVMNGVGTVISADIPQEEETEVEP